MTGAGPESPFVPQENIASGGGELRQSLAGRDSQSDYPWKGKTGVWTTKPRRRANCTKHETHEARPRAHSPSRSSCFATFAALSDFVIQTLSSISAPEAEIDQRVYAFYGLTAEEIRIVEGDGR